jgi:hypothetical protein
MCLTKPWVCHCEERSDEPTKEVPEEAIPPFSAPKEEIASLRSQ